MDNATIHTAPGGQSFILGRDLMTGLMGAVPTLGGHKVIVGFGGDQAFCDKDLSYVNLPAVPEAERIPLVVARQMRGFAAHEAAHLAFTNPSVAIVRRDGTQDALQHSLWNCVEDYMIERFWLELYPGAFKNFAATENWCCERYLQSHTASPAMVYDLRQVGGVALTWIRALYFGLGTTLSQDCLDTLPADHRARVEGWFRTLVAPVESTEEALAAAWIIYDDIMANPLSSHTPASVRKALSQKPKPGRQQGAAQPGQGQQGQGQAGQQAGKGTGQPGQGQGQAQQGQGQSGQQPAQAPGQPGQGQPGHAQAGTHGATPTPSSGTQPQPSPAPGGAPHTTTASSTTGAPTQGPGAATGTPQTPSATLLKPVAPFPTGFDLNAALKTAAVTPSDHSICAPVVSTSKTGVEAAALSRPNGHTRADQVLAGLEGAVGGTAAQLRRSLKTVAKDRWKTGRLDGIMDSRRLAFAATGSMEYHRKKVHGETIDTALSIVVDCSQSMEGQRIATCQQVAVILERALMNTPIAHEILGYTTADIANIDPSLMVAHQAHKARGNNLSISPTSLYVFRPFGARHADAMTGLGGMDMVRMSGTPTHHGIFLAHDRLSRRPERRHVMIVLTDGQSSDSPRTRAAVDAIERCGVTVLGIGINTRTVEREFSKHVVLNSATELPDVMLSTLSGMLLGERRKKGMNATQVRHIRARA